MDKSHEIFYGNICFVCHSTVREKKLKKCSSCKLIFYCSDAHQKIHWKNHSTLCKVILEVESVLKSENLEDDVNWYKYRTNLLLLSEIKLGRKLKPHEINMILFPNSCQVCHKKFDLEACLNCLCVNYCSEDHKKTDFDSHKEVCNLFALCFKLDLFLTKTHFYPNYSLWDENFSLCDSIEIFINNNIKIEKIETISFLEERALVSELVTCPLSLLFALENIDWIDSESFIIHVVGSSFLEVASLKSWEIILHVKPNIQSLIIHFIGPEVEKNINVSLCHSCENKLSFKFSKSLYHDFIKTSCYEKPDAICSFNCGFHEFENSNMDTWDKTLPLLIQNDNVPLIFTSFTQNEAERDSQLLMKKNSNLNLLVLENKFSSLRPYRDIESLGIYFNNKYIGIVLGGA